MKTTAKLLSLLLGWAITAIGYSATPPYSNQGSVGNTRHNLTQRTLDGSGPTPGGALLMDTTRNDYGEVCVYCHTPHGAATSGAGAQLPLWNRTIEARTYQVYSELNSSTITQPITQPGVNSLACLSCHDGQTAVDSVINMPGPGRYLASQATSVDQGFLNTWTNPGIGRPPNSHGRLGVECMICHSTTGAPVLGTIDFTPFVIGTDLRNDHPVGVRYPANGSNADFKNTTATSGSIRFFDTNGNSRPDKNEVRLYDTGDGFEVECASCHDPHGVPSGAAGSQFNPSFLRISNTGSNLCLACHTK